MKRVLFLPIGGMKTASSRLICYENVKYLRELGWDAKVGRAGEVNEFDIVIFQKRFRHGDLHTLSRVKGKAVLQISEAYYLKDSGWEHNIRRFLKRADAVVVSSKPIHSWFKKYHRRSVVIPTGLDFAALPKGKRHPPVKICWIGNTGNEQYLDQVVGAINAIPHSIKFEFRIIGGRRPCLGFNRHIHFIQWQLGKAERQVSECHVGIAPLHCKPYEFAKPPSKPVLYMAQGLAVVATETPTYHSLIRDKVNGFLIHNNDQARWTRVLKMLIKDSKRRNEIAARGMKSCQRYNAPNIAKEWDTFLKGL